MTDEEAQEVRRGFAHADANFDVIRTYMSAQLEFMRTSGKDTNDWLSALHFVISSLAVSVCKDDPERRRAFESAVESRRRETPEAPGVALALDMVAEILEGAAAPMPKPPFPPKPPTLTLTQGGKGRKPEQGQ